MASRRNRVEDNMNLFEIDFYEEGYKGHNKLLFEIID